MKTKYQPTVAVAMIIKGVDDEAVSLANCLASINGYVDAIYLNLNHAKGEVVSKKVRTLCEQYTKNIYVTEWQGNFVKARNFIFSKVPKKYDFIMWLDADDTVDKPEKIRDLAAIVAPSVRGAYIKYDYDHDEYGNCTVTHWVARMVRNDGSYIWKASIDDGKESVHETLNEVIPRPKVMSRDFKIIHHADPSRRISSLVRNTALLESMYQRQTKKGEVDARTLFYLATHYFDAYRLSEAKSLFQDYLQLSGWAEERSEACVYLGQILTAENKPEQAKLAYLMAIGEYQNSTRPYIELAQLEYTNKRYEDSANWIEKALALPKPTTTMVQRPMDTTYRAYMLAAQAYVNMGGKSLDKAQTFITKALKLRPTDPDAQEAQKLIEGLVEQRENIRAASRLLRYYEQNELTDKIVPFIDLLPRDIQDNPLLLTARHNFATPKKWGKKSIAIYVGQGPLGIWGPWSLEDGIGGSEEAVIHLSQQLTNLGWEVAVFATPGERAGDYDGVAWKQFYEFNPKDDYDVLVSWRNPAFFDNKFKARKQYLWLHDVMDKEEFTPERIKNVDKVIFVSQYHANLYKGVIPEKKWLVSGNGIDPQAFIDTDSKFKRDPYRCVYMSAHNRGLKILLDVWDDVKKAVPQANLHLYYGWESYDAINKDNPERMAWKQQVVRQINKLDGVTDHGRIDQPTIVEEIQKSGIMAYPCIFPEVYCISLIKAQAGGAFPVTTDFAVVGDYNTEGVQVPYTQGEIDQLKETYKTELIKQLKAKHNVNTKQIREKFSWLNTALGWDEDMKAWK